MHEKKLSAISYQRSAKTCTHDEVAIGGLGGTLNWSGN
jgi:hypothetical protein